MNFIQKLFESRNLYINGQLTGGNDLAEFARHYKDRRVAVLSQRLLIIGGQATGFYIETN